MTKHDDVDEGAVDRAGVDVPPFHTFLRPALDALADGHAAVPGIRRLPEPHTRNQPR